MNTKNVICSQKAKHCWQQMFLNLMGSLPANPGKGGSLDSV